jgi:conjugal transfer pilus assembly protein TraF
MKKVLFLLSPFLLFAEVKKSDAAINNSFFETGNHSWFFGYNDVNETNKTNKITKKINPYDLKQTMKLPDDEFMNSIPLNNLDLFKADDFKKTFKRVRGIAVMQPTQKNVYIMKKMQKFMTDQAEKFARVWYVQTIQHPNELGYPDINPASFAQTATYYKKKKETDEFFKKHKNDIGYIVFYNPADKMSNIRQKWIYNTIKKDYGYDVVWIDVTKRPDLVKKFNIKEVPDNFYVYKNKKGEGIWVRVKAGLASEGDIKENTMFTFKNIIAKKDKK